MKIVNKAIGKLDYKIKALSPKRLYARLNGVKVLANSIPKAGTHLLTRCLSLFPNLSYTGVHITTGILEVEEFKNILKRNGNGRFTAAHLWWSKEFSHILANYFFKTILMLRDPRDIVVSQAYFIPNKRDHHLYKYFSELASFDNCLTACIRGVDASNSKKGFELSNIKKMFQRYTPWIDESFNLTIRFEDLIGPTGGGDFILQIAQIERIAKHLGLNLATEGINNIAGKIFNKKSATFRKGVIGDWRHHFSDNHKKLFKEIAGQLLIEYGYEKSYDW